jgi:hypothetical protein
LGRSQGSLKTGVYERHGRDLKLQATDVEVGVLCSKDGEGPLFKKNGNH